MECLPFNALKDYKLYPGGDFLSYGKETFYFLPVVLPMWMGKEQRA